MRIQPTSNEFLKHNLYENLIKLTSNEFLKHNLTAI